MSFPHYTFPQNTTNDNNFFFWNFMFFNLVPQLLFFQFYSWKNCCFVIYFDLFLMWLLRYQKTFLAFGIRLENEAKKKRKKLNFVFLNLLFVQRLFDIFFPRDLAKTVFYPCSFPLCCFGSKLYLSFFNPSVW
jgi:hypothetical protein